MEHTDLGMAELVALEVQVTLITKGMHKQAALHQNC